METTELSPAISFPCQHLRSKEMYYQPPGQDEDEFSSGIYWCTKTQENFGPDGRPVGKIDCCARRSCYIS
jgi:hypothetical protein